MLIYLQTIETPADESKFTAIYNAYCGLAYHIAFGHMKNEHDAQDVVQHVFMKIAENIKIIKPVSPKTKQYLVTMVNNRVADVFRLRGRHPISPLNEDLDYSSSREPEGVNLLMECILKLPYQQRTVILLKYEHGYSLKEIAKMLNISLAWAQKLISERRKTRGTLQGRGR